MNTERDFIEQMSKLKFNKYQCTSIIIFVLLAVYLIIPMTTIDSTSGMLHDGRWWYNQYFEFKESFPNITKVAFSGFNNSGLAFNMLYPNNSLRIIELPLILFNISNPYIVMGFLNIITYSLIFHAIYLITKTFKQQHPIFLSLIFLTFLMFPQNTGPVNSISQQLSIAFVLYGSLGIIQRKYLLIIASSILLLNSSVSTSIIGALTFIVVAAISFQKLKEWLLFSLSGIASIIITLPTTLPIIKHLHDINKPTNGFGHQQLFIIKNFQQLADYSYILNLSRALIGIVFVLGILFIIKDNIKWTYKQYIAWTLVVSIAILNFFPSINDILISPIQPGTWTRIWPLMIIICLILFKAYKSTRNNDLFLIIIGIVTATNIVFTLRDAPYATTQSPRFKKEINNKKWNNVASELQTAVYDVDYEHTHPKLYHKLVRMIADYSIDYMPKKARLKDNRITYTPAHTWQSKYGLEKHSINNGKTLKITINPKNKVTPLGVWHYDFIKYKVKSTHGRVVITKHDMFEYHGTKKTTIFITTK